MTKTLPAAFTILDDFPAVSYQQWRTMVEESLQGAPFEKKLVTHTYEGLQIQPVYARDNTAVENHAIGLPGLAPFVRNSQPLGAVRSGWDLRQEHAHPELAVTNAAILADLRGGVTSVLLQLDAAAGSGYDPDQAPAELVGQDGLMAYSAADLDVALANVHLDLVGIALDGGAAALPAAAALVALWQRRGVTPEQARGAFNADPFAVLARNGQLPQTPAAALAALADLAKWTTENYPHVTAIGVDTSPYHDAGATAAQDIAFGLATAVEYLRALTAAGLDINVAARQLLFRVELGTHHFLALAKLRAARGNWSRVIEACGGQPQSGAMAIHARTSHRVLTQRDPYVNLLRNAVAMFAAGIGGANVVTSVPFDALTGLPDAFSRRIARNTVHILQEEAHLHRVIDPAGGSWFLDDLTARLSEKAWEIFQEVERQGGMLAALQSGWIAQQIDAAYAPRTKDIARRKEGITGVSEFPNLREPRVAPLCPDAAVLRAAAQAQLAKTRTSDAACAPPQAGTSHMAAMVAAAASGATIGQMAQALGFHQHPSARIAPLERRSFAEPFEELRDASDAWEAAHGQRPRVFLVNLGPIAHHTGRATYSQNFFEAGGFEVLSNNGFDDVDQATAAFAKSGAKIAVICSSDKLYPQFVPLVAPKLKAAGARTVVLAGFPGDNGPPWQAAGVDRFIYIKCDVLETLRELLREEGVLTSQEG